MKRKVTRLLKQLFGPTLVDDEGAAVEALWVMSVDRSYLINPATNRIYASLWDDGFGKIYPTLYVSIVGLIRIYFAEMPVTVSLRTFPKFAVDLIRLKRPVCLVKKIIEEYLGISPG